MNSHPNEIQLWWSTIPTMFFPTKEGKDPIFSFLDSLPDHIKRSILNYLSPVASIFIKEVLEKEKDFNLYAICTEIHSGPMWMWRKDAIISNNDEWGQRWGPSFDIHNRITGSGWDIEPWDEDYGQTLQYIRGSKVPLWWIRTRRGLSPFYKISERWDFDGTSTGTRIEDIIWGSGPEYKMLVEYGFGDRFYELYNIKKGGVLPPSKNVDEVSFRKNMCCMTLMGCTCGNMLPQKYHRGFEGTRGKYRKLAWHKHQVKDIHKDCSMCIDRNKTPFGDDVSLYETRCLYTRPRCTVSRWVSGSDGWGVDGCDFRFPYINKQDSRKQKRRSRQRKNKLNRRISKSPIT